ncbi:hypothetical protein HK102_004333 [Quaeritorhiza haematococci]|nr:hypothetical protein HK102_004333 [Quaeritorhiza haematococci]
MTCIKRIFLSIAVATIAVVLVSPGLLNVFATQIRRRKNAETDAAAEPETNNEAFALPSISELSYFLLDQVREKMQEVGPHTSDQLELLKDELERFRGRIRESAQFHGDDGFGFALDVSGYGGDLPVSEGPLPIIHILKQIVFHPEAPVSDLERKLECLIDGILYTILQVPEIPDTSCDHQFYLEN